MPVVANDTTAYRVFRAASGVLLVLMALLCIFPMLNVLATSLSSPLAIRQGRVIAWPVELTPRNYLFLVDNEGFWSAMLMSLLRVALGTAVQMTVIVLTAYPLSRPSQTFPSRPRYVWFFLFTMLFGGGLIPFFLVVRYSGLLNTIWALVIPNAVPVYNIILMLNFFRQLPREMEEAAFIDGAGHLTTLLKIYLPTSLPALATVGLFVMVYHWNEWFMPILFLQRTELYPLQAYLRRMILSASFEVQTYEDAETLRQLSQRGINAAQIFLAMLPILCVYPFLQRYFAKGIVLGSVKG